MLIGRQLDVNCDQDCAVNIKDNPGNKHDMERIAKTQTRFLVEHAMANLSELDIGRWDIIATDDDSIPQDGTKRFREFISVMKAPYQSKKRKRFQTSLSYGIVAFICSVGSRFVKWDSIKGKWYLLTKKQARYKVAQALREDRVQVDKYGDQLLDYRLCNPC